MIPIGDVFLVLLVISLTSLITAWPIGFWLGRWLGRFEKQWLGGYELPMRNLRPSALLVFMIFLFGVFAVPMLGFELSNVLFGRDVWLKAIHPLVVIACLQLAVATFIWFLAIRFFEG